MVLGLALGGACSASPGATPVSDTTAAPPVAAADPTAAAQAAPAAAPNPGPPGTGIARLRADLEVRQAPDTTAPVVTTVPARTGFGSRSVLSILDEHDGWLEVLVPGRPNGRTGWVPADEVERRRTTRQVTVDLAARELIVADGDRELLRSAVAVGADETPTPTGRFFVTDLVRTPQPTGPYGPFALGLSGRSDVLDQFGGGDGQIAIHGTNAPDSIGRAASHGCVRVPNDVVGKLAELLVLGTPVTIR